MRRSAYLGASRQLEAVLPGSERQLAPVHDQAQMVRERVVQVRATVTPAVIQPDSAGTAHALHGQGVARALDKGHGTGQRRPRARTSAA